MNESHQHLLLYSETLYADIQYFGLQRKNILDKLHDDKEEKEKKCWYTDFVKEQQKKKESVKYQVEVWTAYAEQQNAMNVTYKHQRPLTSQHKEPRVKCHWSCVCSYTCVCYWGNASSFISMRGLSWLSRRRLGPIMLFLCLNDLDLLGEFGFLSDFLFLAFFSAP